MGSRARLLKETPIFGAIREDIIDFVLERSATPRLGKGSYLFREGDRSDSMYVIEQGEIAIVKRHQEHEYLLRKMGSGDCIGEMSLFDLMPRSASAYVLGDVQMIEITTATLMDIYQRDLEQFALLQMNMGREVTRRLRLCDERRFQAGRDSEFPVLGIQP